MTPSVAVASFGLATDRRIFGSSVLHLHRRPRRIDEAALADVPSAVRRLVSTPPAASADENIPNIIAHVLYGLEIQPMMEEPPRQPDHDRSSDVERVVQRVG